MIKVRRLQASFADGLIAEEVSALYEPWMRHSDQILDDDQLLNLVQQELSKRIRKSRTRGRPGTPAEVVLRLLLLQHIRDWSYDILVREVRANLVYRHFTRIGGGVVPDDKTMGRWGRQLSPETIQNLHRRVVAIAQEKQIVQGKRMRVDTTVVATNVHYPTDSSLLGDGVRVLTRLLKKATQIAGDTGTKLRNRSRSVKLRMIEIARASRSKSPPTRKRMRGMYEKLVASTVRVVGQAKKFVTEIATGVKNATRSTDLLAPQKLEGIRKELEKMLPRVKTVIEQTRARVFQGNTHFPGKVFSIFEPHTELIRRGKTDKPNEFGKLIKVQEAEGQIVTDYEVYDKRPADGDLLAPAVEIHEQRLGRVPELVAADAGFYSAKGEKAVSEKGVKKVSVPNRSTKSEERKKMQKARWFKKGQKYRTGCEGRISVLKRRHGLDRCLNKGEEGMKRWVGLGVIADNLINIGSALATALQT
jgi:transposase, IS5 family